MPYQFVALIQTYNRKKQLWNEILNKYKNDQYNRFLTSYEILEAIEYITRDDILDEYSRAIYMWSEVRSDDIEKIVEYLNIHYPEWDEYYWKREKLKKVKKDFLGEAYGGYYDKTYVLQPLSSYDGQEERQRLIIRGDGEEKAS